MEWDHWPNEGYPCKYCGQLGHDEEQCGKKAALPPVTEATRTVESIAAILGWVGTPPRHVLEQEIKILQARARADHGYIERLALCSDHRDKATGRCIVCHAEERTRAELRRQPVEIAELECPWCGDRIMHPPKPSGGCLTAEVRGRVWHPRCAEEYEAAKQAARENA